MSQMENMAVPAVGNISKEELLELKKAMNATLPHRSCITTRICLTKQV